MRGIHNTINSSPVNSRYSYEIGNISKNEKVQFLKSIEQDMKEYNGFKIKTQYYVDVRSKKERMYGKTFEVKVKNNYDKGGSKSALLFGSEAIFFGFSGDRFYIVVPSIEIQNSWVGNSGYRTIYINHNVNYKMARMLHDKLVKSAKKTIPRATCKFNYIK